MNELISITVLILKIFIIYKIAEFSFWGLVFIFGLLVAITCKNNKTKATKKDKKSEVKCDGLDCAWCVEINCPKAENKGKEG